MLVLPWVIIMPIQDNDSLENDTWLPTTLTGRVFVAAGSAASVTVVEVTTPSDGVFGFTVEAIAGQTGPIELVVEVEDSPGAAVRLMPTVTIRVLEPEADFNGDGVFDFFDVAAFLAAFAAGDASADLNGDGVVDMDDVWLFVALLTG